MVSLFAFFTGKKKSKSKVRAPSPTSQAQGRAERPSPPTRQRSSNRFLSLRGKTSKPYDVSKRDSRDEDRRRTLGASIVRPDAEEAPRLTLGWEGRARTTGLQAREVFVGLDQIGRPPILKSDEIDVLRKQKWACEEVLQGWKWFGASLKESAGLETLGIMLPLRVGQDQDVQYLLLALFTLAIRPKLASFFPSLADFYSRSKPAEDGTVAEPQSGWTERLLNHLEELGNAIDKAEVLKFLLRHLSLSPVLPHSLDPSSPLKPFLDDETYGAFVRGERESSYNVQAYELIFLPRLRMGVVAYLEEIFEVWAAIVVLGDVNRMGGGRIPLLLGWWVWGLGSSDRSRSWNQLYDEWRSAGRKVEHLFYAWIRNQSTRQKLPIRLLEVVERYPFTADQEANEAPRPPPSTFARKTLHVSLQTLQTTARASTPAKILNHALNAKVDVDSTAPIFEALRVNDPQAVEPVLLSVDDLLAEDSKAFLEQSPSVKGEEKSKLAIPASSDAPIERSRDTAGDLPLYRPFSVVSQQLPTSRMTRRRSQSLGDTDTKPLSMAISPLQALSEEVEGLINSSPSRLKKRPSESVIHREPNEASGGGALWENFEKSGFGNSPEPDLQLSPPSSPTALSSMAQDSISLGYEKIDLPRTKRSSIKPSIPSICISAECVIDVDDLFMAFVEDGQLDPSTQSWPSFALVRLARPYVSDESSAIEWLLVTMEPRPPPVPEKPAQNLPERSVSPGAISTSSKFGSSFGLFRRTSSSMSIRNSGRRSIFGGGSRAESKHSRSIPNLASLPESQSATLRAASADANNAAPVTTMSTAPTEYTITDLGDMVKVTNTQDDNALQFDPCSETHARDWSYRAEGGAHFIFGYDGSAKGYVDRVLRIQKAVAASGPDETMRRVWVMDLLPKLLPRDLLLQSVLVELQEKWLKELMSTDMSKRPEERKGSMAGTASLTDSISGSTHGWIMDDLIARGKKEESVLCVEIKPKWGFLPDQQHVQPPEAAGIKSQIPRFHLHEHFRGNYTSEDVGYNPLDLFSGQQARMKKALEGLWLGWEASEGRKNNWRVYVDGQVVLPASPIDVPTTGSKQSVRDSTIDLVLPCLISSNVFGLVGRLQSRLDATDISDLATRYGAEYPDAEPFAGSASSEATEAELRTLVARFVAASANPQPQSWSLRESLIAYSLAAIFKDCSIFVRIPLARKDGSWQVSANPSVKVVDVDLKPLCSMRKWYDLDEKLWKHWYENPPTITKAEVPPELGAPIEASSFPRPGPFTSPSVRALYVPTPDRSAPHTPMEVNEQHMRNLQAMTDKDLPNSVVAGQMSSTVDDPHHDAPEAPEAPEAEVLVDPPTPIQLSDNTKRGSEAVSLADALSITPSTTHFAFSGRDRDDNGEDLVRPLQELPEEPEAVHLLPLKESAEPTPAYNGSVKNLPEVPAQTIHAPAVLDQTVVNGRTNVRSEAQTSPTDDRSFPPPSPGSFRRERSLAPSPSPQLEFKDLPVLPADEPSRLAAGTLESPVDIEKEPEPIKTSDLASQQEQPIGHQSSMDGELHSENSGKALDDAASGPTQINTSSRSIASLAGTAAAVSVAAVAGTIGAVAGVATAVVGAASPTRSTFAQDDEDSGEAHGEDGAIDTPGRQSSFAAFDQAHSQPVRSLDDEKATNAQAILHDAEAPNMPGADTYETETSTAAIENGKLKLRAAAIAADLPDAPSEKGHTTSEVSEADLQAPEATSAAQVSTIEEDAQNGLHTTQSQIVDELSGSSFEAPDNTEHQRSSSVVEPSAGILSLEATSKLSALSDPSQARAFPRSDSKSSVSGERPRQPDSTALANRLDLPRSTEPGVIIDRPVSGHETGQEPEMSQIDNLGVPGSFPDLSAPQDVSDGLIGVSDSAVSPAEQSQPMDETETSFIDDSEIPDQGSQERPSPRTAAGRLDMDETTSANGQNGLLDSAVQIQQHVVHPNAETQLEPKVMETLVNVETQRPDHSIQGMNNLEDTSFSEHSGLQGASRKLDDATRDLEPGVAGSDPALGSVADDGSTVSPLNGHDVPMDPLQEAAVASDPTDVTPFEHAEPLQTGLQMDSRESVFPTALSSETDMTLNPLNDASDMNISTAPDAGNSPRDAHVVDDASIAIVGESLSAAPGLSMGESQHQPIPVTTDSAPSPSELPAAVTYDAQQPVEHHRSTYDSESAGSNTMIGARAFDELPASAQIEGLADQPQTQDEHRESPFLSGLSPQDDNSAEAENVAFPTQESQPSSVANDPFSGQTPSMGTTPFMTPGSMAQDMGYPFDRDVPSRLSFATADFATPTSEPGTPKVASSEVDHDTPKLAGPYRDSDDHHDDHKGPVVGLSNDDGDYPESAADRTFGESSLVSEAAPLDTQDHSIKNPLVPFVMPGLEPEIPARMSNPFLSSQEVQVNSLYHPAPPRPDSASQRSLGANRLSDGASNDVDTSVRRSSSATFGEPDHTLSEGQPTADQEGRPHA